MNKKTKMITIIGTSTGVVAAGTGAGLGVALSLKSNSDDNGKARLHTATADWSLLRLGDTLQVQGITATVKGHAHVKQTTLDEAHSHGYTFTIKETSPSGIGYSEVFTVVAQPLSGFAMTGQGQKQFTSQAAPAPASPSVVAKRAAVKAIALLDVDSEVKNFATKTNTFLDEVNNMHATIKTTVEIDQITVETTLDAQKTLREQYNNKVNAINNNLLPLIQNIKTNHIPGLTIPTNPSTTVINTFMTQVNTITFAPDSNGLKYTASATIDSTDPKALNIEVGIADATNSLVASSVIKVSSMRTQAEQQTIDNKKATVAAIVVPTISSLASGATLPTLSTFNFSAKQARIATLKSQIASSNDATAIASLEAQINAIVAEINNMNADIARANNLANAQLTTLVSQINALALPAEVTLVNGASVITPYDYAAAKNDFDSKVASTAGKTIAQLTQLKTDLEQIIHDTATAMNARTAANTREQNLVASISAQITALTFPAEVTLLPGATVSTPFDYAAHKNGFDAKVATITGKTSTELMAIKVELQQFIHDSTLAMNARTTANAAVGNVALTILKNDIAALTLPSTTAVTAPFKSNIATPNSFDIDAKVSEFNTLKTSASTMTTATQLSGLKTQLETIKTNMTKWVDIFNHYKSAVDANYQVAADTTKQADTIDEYDSSDVYIQGKPAGYTLSVIGKTVATDKLSISFDFVISFTYQGIYIELPQASGAVSGFVNPVTLLNAETKTATFSGTKTTTLASEVTDAQLTFSSAGTTAMVVSLTPDNAAGSLDVEYQISGATVSHHLTISGFMTEQAVKDSATATFDHASKASTLASVANQADLTSTLVDNHGITLNVVIESLDRDDAAQTIVVHYHFDGTSRSNWGNTYTISGFKAAPSNAPLSWSSFTGTNIDITGLYDTENNHDDDSIYATKVATIDSATVTIQDIANLFDFGNGDNIDKIKETVRNAYLPHQFRDKNDFHYYVDSWNTMTISHREDGKVTLSGKIYAIDGTTGIQTIDLGDRSYWRVVSEITLTGLSHGASAQLNRIKSEIAAISLNAVPTGTTHPTYDFVAKQNEFATLKATATSMVSIANLNALKTQVQNFANDFNQKILDAISLKTQGAVLAKYEVDMFIKNMGSIDSSTFTNVHDPRIMIKPYDKTKNADYVLRNYAAVTTESDSIATSITAIHRDPSDDTSLIFDWKITLGGGVKTGSTKMTGFRSSTMWSRLDKYSNVVYKNLSHAQTGSLVPGSSLNDMVNFYSTITSKKTAPGRGAGAESVITAIAGYLGTEQYDVWKTKAGFKFMFDQNLNYPDWFKTLLVKKFFANTSFGFGLLTLDHIIFTNKNLGAAGLGGSGKDIVINSLPYADPSSPYGSYANAFIGAWNSHPTAAWNTHKAKLAANSGALLNSLISVQGAFSILQHEYGHHETQAFLSSSATMPNGSGAVQDASIVKALIKGGYPLAKISLAVMADRLSTPGPAYKNWDWINKNTILDSSSPGPTAAISSWLNPTSATQYPFLSTIPVNGLGGIIIDETIPNQGMHYHYGPLEFINRQYNQIEMANILPKELKDIMTLSPIINIDAVKNTVFNYKVIDKDGKYTRNAIDLYESYGRSIFGWRNNDVYVANDGHNMTAIGYADDEVDFVVINGVSFPAKDVLTNYFIREEAFGEQKHRVNRFAYRAVLNNSILTGATSIAGNSIKLVNDTNGDGVYQPTDTVVKTATPTSGLHVKADFSIFPGDEDQQVTQTWSLLDGAWTGKTFNATTEPQFVYNF